VSFVIFMLLSVSLPAIHYSKTAWSSPVFCNTHELATNKLCVVCPTRGKCTGGELTCDRNYVQSGVHCIEDSNHVNQVRAIFSLLEAKVTEVTEQEYVKSR
jgi:hypothetical protein